VTATAVPRLHQHRPRIHRRHTGPPRSARTRDISTPGSTRRRPRTWRSSTIRAGTPATRMPHRPPKALARTRITDFSRCCSRTRSAACRCWDPPGGSTRRRW